MKNLSGKDSQPKYPIMLAYADTFRQLCIMLKIMSHYHPRLSKA